MRILHTVRSESGQEADIAGILSENVMYMLFCCFQIFLLLCEEICGIQMGRILNQLHVAAPDKSLFVKGNVVTVASAKIHQ